MKMHMLHVQSEFINVIRFGGFVLVVTSMHHLASHCTKLQSFTMMLVYNSMLWRISHIHNV